MHVRGTGTAAMALLDISAEGSLSPGDRKVIGMLAVGRVCAQPIVL